MGMGKEVASVTKLPKYCKQPVTEMPLLATAVAWYVVPMPTAPTTTTTTATAAAVALHLHLANVPGGGRYTLALQRCQLALPGTPWVAVAYTWANTGMVRHGQGAPVQRVALYNTATGAVRTVPAIAWAPAQGLPYGTATLWAELAGQ